MAVQVRHKKTPVYFTYFTLPGLITTVTVFESGLVRGNIFTASGDEVDKFWISAFNKALELPSHHNILKITSYS